MLAVDPGFPDPSPTSRFDSFFASDDELYFTEFNTETPAGAGYSDALAELFYGLPAFQEFQRRSVSLVETRAPGSGAEPPALTLPPRSRAASLPSCIARAA